MIIGAYAAPRLTGGQDEVDAVVSELSRFGVSDVYLLAKQCSVMTYPSRIAPSLPEAEEWDPFGAMSLSAADAGIRVHAWFKLFPENSRAPSPIIPKPTANRRPRTWGRNRTTCATKRFKANKIPSDQPPGK